VVDNYRIRFMRRETKRIDEQAEWRKISFRNQADGDKPEPAPAKFPEPYDAVIVANFDLATHGQKLMIRGEWLTDHHGHPHIPRTNVVVDDGDLVRELHVDIHDTTLTICGNQALYRAGNREQQMFYELALGVGFGRRIKAVESVVKTDDGWRVTGIFQLWTEDQTTFELEADADLFVRKAQLRAVVHPRETWFEFANAGSVETAGKRAFAKTGRLQRIYAAHVPPNGTRLDVGQSFGKIEQQYELEVGSVDFELTDEHYAELSAIDAAQADSVIDERPKN